MKHVLIGFLLLSAGSVMAGDGKFEINQLCVTFGCFEGDTPGFPVQITQPGSYVLTSNLNVNSINITAITTSSSRVTVDLNGFSIEGPGCGGGSCPGTGDGINLNFSLQGTVKNGTITGMGRNGLNCAGSCIVENVHSRANGANGMVVNEATILNSVAKSNGENGIEISTGIIEGAVVTRNDINGIVATAAVISRVRVRFNGDAPSGRGILCDGCSIFDSIITNEHIGIEFLNNSVWGRNLLYNNTGANFGGFDTPTSVDINRCSGLTC